MSKEIVLYSSFWEDSYGSLSKREFAKQCIEEDYAGKEIKITDDWVDDWITEDNKNWWSDFKMQLESFFKKDKYIININDKSKMINNIEDLEKFIGEYDDIKYISNDKEITIYTELLGAKNSSNYYTLKKVGA